MEMSRNFETKVTLVFQKTSKIDGCVYVGIYKAGKVPVPVTLLVKVYWRYRNFENQTFTVVIISWVVLGNS